MLSNEERAESQDGRLECRSNDWWDHLDRARLKSRSMQERMTEM